MLSRSTSGSSLGYTEAPHGRSPITWPSGTCSRSRVATAHITRGSAIQLSQWAMICLLVIQFIVIVIETDPGPSGNSEFSHLNSMVDLSQQLHQRVATTACGKPRPDPRRARSESRARKDPRQGNGEDARFQTMGKPKTIGFPNRKEGVWMILLVHTFQYI